MSGILLSSGSERRVAELWKWPLFLPGEKASAARRSVVTMPVKYDIVVSRSQVERAPGIIEPFTEDNLARFAVRSPGFPVLIRRGQDLVTYWTARSSA